MTHPRQPELPEWLRELYPFDTRKLQLGSHQMSFVDEGPQDAAPIILLHGNPTWSFLYRDLIRRAREKHRVIAPDNIGFGLSDKPEDTTYHKLEQHISNFTRLMESLSLQNVTLVMNGWGGPIGLGYAIAYPKNIARMVLVNTWGANLPGGNRMKVPLGVRLAAKGRIGAWLDALLNLSMHSIFSSRTHRAMSDLAMEAYTYPFPTRASRAGILAFTEMFADPDGETVGKLAEIHDGLKNISAPVTILWGERDPVLSKLAAYLLRDELKHAGQPIFVRDVSHYLPEEAPDVLAEAVLREDKPVVDAKTDSAFKIIG